MLDSPPERSFQESATDIRSARLASSRSPLDDDESFQPPRESLQDEPARERLEQLSALLQRRIEEIETIFDVVPIGLGIADDPKCSAIRVNPALAHMLGIEPGSNASKSSAGADLLPFRYVRDGVEIPADDLPMQRAARRGEDVEATIDVELADGRLLTLWHAARPLYDTEGKLVGSVVAVTDITDQTRDARIAKFVMRASEVLASSFDLRKTLTTLGRLTVPHMADLYSVDLLTESGDIERVTSRMMTGGDASDEVMPPIAALQDMPEHPANDVLRTGVSFFADGRDGAIAERLTHRADLLARWRALHLRSLIIVPMEARGKMLGVMTFATTSARRRFDRRDLAAAVEVARRAATSVDNARLLEAAEQSTDDANRANRAKSDFLAAMSHELRTPLNAIAGYSQLMLLGLRGEISNEQRDDLVRIEHNQRHLLGLINSILNFAKLDAGTVQYDLQPHAVCDLLASVEPMIGPQMQAKGLHYIQTPCEDDLRVLVDKDKTRQILLNLLSNAVKFTASGGTVTIGCAQANGFATIYVRDTGAGIAREKLPHVFEPFVQLGRTLSTMHEGVGLGLAISRDLARGMGGDITVASEVGHGSLFSIALPVAPVIVSDVEASP